MEKGCEIEDGFGWRVCVYFTVEVGIYRVGGRNCEFLDVGRC